MKYKDLGQKLSHASSTKYWDLIDCIPRCQYTKYVLKPMIEGNLDQNKMMNKPEDGANNEVRMQRHHYHELDRFHGTHQS